MANVQKTPEKTEINEGKLLLVTSFDCKQGAVRAVRFNGDGNYCLTCGSDKSVRLWNPHRQLQLKVYMGHGYDVMDAQASCDNSQICSGSLDKSVILFDVGTGKSLRRYRGHAGAVNCVKFNEESTVILSGGLDSNVRIWDCRSRKMEPIQILSEPKDSVTSLQVSDHEILVGSADGKVRTYDLRIGKLFSDHIGNAVSCVNFTRDGQCLLVSTGDNSVRLFDKSTGEMLNEYTGHKSSEYKLIVPYTLPRYTGHKSSEYKLESCLNSQDTQVLSGSDDGHIYVWDLVEAKVLDKLDHKTSRPVHSLTFHPNTPCLLSACKDKVYLWKSDSADDDG